MSTKNLFLFYGSDNFTANNKLQHWRQEFEKKYGDLNIHIFDGENFTAGDFDEAVSTLPFLSEKKLILIRDFLKNSREEDRKSVAEKLDEIPEHCVVVFIEREAPDARTAIYKKLCKAGQAIEFKDLEKPELIKWIKEEFAKKNSGIGAHEAEILADSVGPDLWQMSHEIEKLTLFSKDLPIDEKAIEDLTNANLSSSIFKLTDHLAAKNSRASIKTLNTLLLSGEDLMQIFFMIVRHFRILIQTRACLKRKMDRNMIVRKTGIHPFAAMNAINQSRNFTDEKLAWIYKKLLQIDIDTKSSRIRITAGDNTELRLALEKIMVALCNG
jgi:DNA polymerase III subunit delta